MKITAYLLSIQTIFFKKLGRFKSNIQSEISIQLMKIKNGYNNIT